MLKGIPASPGIVSGKAFLYGREQYTISRRPVKEEQIQNELKRFKDALVQTKNEILDIKKRISEEMSAKHAQIFSAHLLVIEDSMLIEEVISKLKKEKLSIEYIFQDVLRRYIKVFSEMDDEYLKERISDINDVGRRILRNLIGAREDVLSNLKEKVIVIAYDLSPSDTATMHKRNVKGFATDIGGRTSHTAIMAKSLEIPAVVGLEILTKKVESGDEIIIDGTHGIIVVNPAPRTMKKYEQDREKFIAFAKHLLDLKDLPCVTLDGKNIGLAANIEVPEDVPSVMAHGADCIGLYRTEYFYMNRKDLPTEEEQFKAYSSVAKRMKPNPVTIRTMDLGGDKFLSQLDVPQQMNPFLGWRAIRFCLARPDIFKTQLRAILRASALGKLRLMYPMISGIGELKQANALLEDSKKELKKEGLAFDENMEVGAMIEVPSAALTSDILAKEADFFSIGTNDLIQYSLAVDRVNEKIAYLYEPAHPAILRLIKSVIDNGHKAGIWVGMCGEMAGDIIMTIILLGLGLDEFSTSPIASPEIKRVIRSVTISQAEEVAHGAMALSTGKEVETYAKKKLREIVPDIAAELE
ncbi:MAG: phosphoenolpyruvate--protein phosphotransferase [Candidatus Omnitrophica bacterium]|nr:phosphoenolpyruvate--protein phosphotransferase [Candidatus Omnitrophota bacterium]MBU1038363.1 phosphoenolpyruvate--protein phosphotransferase [Candidatus Omnitrophota bacterium]MBU1808680.1 phosphoenolpyruvate--protein phosphotransferase [Candidatus Omnitrophota bacterium]